MNSAATECDSLLKVINTPMDVFTVDAQAGPKQLVRSLREIKFTGGGGTDMCVGIEAAMDTHQKPNFIVLFTDGYTPWPDAPINHGNTRLIVCLVGDHACDTSQVPQWATTLKITSEDLREQE